MRRSMMLAAVAALVTFVLGAPALAAGPSESKESKDGQVTCNHDVGASNGGANAYGNGSGVFVGPSGAEVCSDNDDNVDGRAMVSTEGYVAVDGDKTNPSQGTSWARLDSGGPTCGDSADNPKTDKDNDSTYDQGAACP